MTDVSLPAPGPAVGGGPPVALVSPGDVRDAGVRIRGVVHRTPTIDIPIEDGDALVLKCENLQVTGSFKVRGAVNLVARHAAGSRTGVVTYSSGNHAQAVAFAARHAGLPCVAVVPTTAPAIKVRAIEALGAEVIREGTLWSDRRDRATHEAGVRGLLIVPPSDHPDIIAGQATAGVELMDDRPGLTSVFVPVGGGGLLSGVAAAVKHRNPAIQVVGVEPAGAARMTLSRRAGRPVALDRAVSIADGLLPLEAGPHAWAHVCALVDDLVSVDDASIVAAMLWLFERAKLVVEPSGAAALAGALSCLAAGRLSGRTGVVVSGGNIALATMARIAAELDVDGGAA
jgi:threonine dehydratase